MDASFRLILILLSLQSAISSISGTSNPLAGPKHSARNESLSYTSDSSDRRVLGGQVQLCLDSVPDGFAMLEDTSSKSELLLTFKGPSLWIHSLSELAEFINSGQDRQLYTSEDQVTASTYLPGFPVSPDYVISFTGLNSNHVFYNNILVFEGLDLFRYKIDALVYKDWPKSMNATLVSSHKTSFWFNFVNLNDLQCLKIIRGTRVMVSLNNWITSEDTVYVLNEHNLDNPMNHMLGSMKSALDSSIETSARFSYTTAANQTLSILATGYICMDSKCVAFRRALKCEAEIQIFLDSFGYWLWQKSDLNLRLMMVAMISIMSVNVILSLAFVYNQLRRISDLS